MQKCKCCESEKLLAEQREKVLTADEKLSFPLFTARPRTVSLSHTRHFLYVIPNPFLFVIRVLWSWMTNAPHPHKHIYTAIQM